MKHSGYFYTRWHNKYIRIEITEILYVEGARNYCKIVTAKQAFIVHNTIKNLVALFGEDSFQRIHKSYVVNLNFIQSFDRFTVHMGHQELPLGSNFRNALEKRLIIL